MGTTLDDAFAGAVQTLDDDMTDGKLEAILEQTEAVIWGDATRRAGYALAATVERRRLAARLDALEDRVAQLEARDRGVSP